MNVTWRNFNVDNNDPDVQDPTVPKGFKALKFLAPGAPDKARYMTLEVIGKLPDGAKAVLEAPLVSTNCFTNAISWVRFQ
jgi:hypothetical protein